MRHTIDPISAAIRQAHAAGEFKALDRVFAHLGRTVAGQLGLFTKAADREPPAPNPDLDADPHAALLLAQLDHLIRCAETGADPGPGDRALHALWHEPEALAGVLAPHVADEPVHVQKSIAFALFLKAAEHAPKGGIHLAGKFFPGGQWIPAAVVAAASPEEKQELAERKAGARPNPKSRREVARDAAQARRGTREQVRKHVATIATDIMLHPGDRTPDKYRDLAAAVSAAVKDNYLTVADLRALRLKLSASFGGGRRKEHMIAALLAHATAEIDERSRPQPDEPPGAPAEPKKPKAPKPGTFAVLRTDSLSIDPARFQFKQKVNAAGVTKELDKVKQFNPDFAGVIAVWHDPADGKTYVVNGHHRFELARRTGYPSLAVRYLAAKDAREARAKGALINIAEGRGTALDAAKFLRDSGRGPDDLYEHGISPDGALVRDAAILTKLNDHAFDRLARGALDMKTALAVAKYLTDPDRQEKLFKLIAKREEEGKDFTARHLEEMARQMAAAPAATTTTSTLWGDETSEDDTFMERADLASHVRSQLAKEHNDYSALSSERRAGATADAGNVLATEENKKRAAELDVHKHAFDTLAHRKGPVADALDRGAVALKTATTKQEKEHARSSTLDAVRRALAGAATGRPADAGPAEAAVGPGVGGVGGGRAEGGGDERAAPSPTGAGEAAADGGGPGAGAPGLAPEPAEQLSSPNGPAAPPAPEPPAGAVEASPLHKLARFAGNPAALKAESEKLAAAASHAGGDLSFHDAMTAALRGEHGPETRDAVSRALDDWDSHKGDLAKRYARVAEEVAKGGTQAQPQAEVPPGPPPAEPAGPTLGEEKPAAPAPAAKPALEAPGAAQTEHAGTPEAAGLDALAANAIPREELQKTHRNLMKYQDLHKHGYTISHWLNPSNPDDQVLEYNPTAGAGRVSGRPRLTARTGEEVEAIHDALGIPTPPEGARQKKTGRDEKGFGTRTRGRNGLPGNPHKPPAAHPGEAHQYATHSAKEIIEHPAMTDEQRAAAKDAEKLPLPADRSEMLARENFAPEIMKIGEGDSAFVGGHRVRNTGGGRFQVEKKDARDWKAGGELRGGFLTGSAEDVSAAINNAWQKQVGYESLPAALDRAEKHEAADPFSDPAAADREAKLRATVPEGAKAVSLDDNTRGRVGVVARDPEGGHTYLKLDGSETKATDFEPLDVKHSWRAPSEEKAKVAPKGGATGDLFSEPPAAPSAAPAPAVESSDVAHLTKMRDRYKRLHDEAKAELDRAFPEAAKTGERPTHGRGYDDRLKTVQEHAKNLEEADRALAAAQPKPRAETDRQKATREAVENYEAESRAKSAEPPTSAPNVVEPAAGAGGHLAHVALSDELAKTLKNRNLQKNELWQHADKAFGGTRAEGKYGPSDAYDALEAGLNKSFAGQTDPTADLAHAQEQARALEAVTSALPTQTNRSGTKESHQQFSTPPHYAFAANWIANLKPTDHVLEPSAGTGSLAVHAKNAGATVHVNELDPRRADFLRDQFGPESTHVENAEQIAGILPKKGVRPTAVVMNPPFSQTAGRLGDKKELLTGARHIAEAGRMLAPGGRLVAIVGGGVARGDRTRGAGMSPDSPTYKKWFAEMAKNGFTLRGNVGVGGDEYKKYGTTFPTRILVFDKVPPAADSPPPVLGNAADIPDLMAKLEGVRNDRPDVARPAPGEPVRAGLPDGAENEPGAAGAAAPGAGAGVPEAGAEGDVPLAGVAGGTDGAGGATGGGRPGVGDEPAGAGLRATGKRGRKPAGGKGAVAGAAAPPGPAAGGPEAAEDGAGGGQGAGGEPVRQSAPSIPGVRAPERIPVEPIATPEAGAEAKPTSADSLYAPYKPARMKVKGAIPHTTKLVESAAMAAVQPPLPTYRPTLSPDVVENAVREVKNPDGTTSKKPIGISEAGLESIVYAGQAHNSFLQGSHGDKPISGEVFTAPNGKQYRATDLGGDRWELTNTADETDRHDFGSTGELSRSLAGWRRPTGATFVHADEAPRRGFFIGDGTGAGKGRQVAGIILDNVNQGKPKHVWVSEKDKLFHDAKRDWADMGQDPTDVVPFDKLAKDGFKAPKGVAFVTYDKLKSGPKDEAAPRNVDNLIKWLGPDFDGVIAFDEAHNMGNADDTPGPRGTVSASQKAVAAMKLQKALPKAKIVYVSATGATKPENLAYGDRLGLWGKGTAFVDKKDFMAQMHSGGTSAMEAVAQSMKARGLYLARSLSYDGVKTDRLQHPLTDEQKYVYDSLAEGWQKVLQHIDKALESIVGGKENVKHAGRAKSAAMSQFQGAQQRFFNQVITSMMVPTVIKHMETDLKEGRSPVVQLVNTMEAATKRALSAREEGEDLEEIDLSPKQMLIDYLNKSFPVNRMQKVEDENGNVSMVPVTDSEGRPVEDPAAVAMRDELVARAHDLKIPQSPLDQIVNHFGHENVAEATGRHARIVRKPDENGVVRLQEEKRNPKLANEAETRAFQGGKKKVMVFSEAGGTGASYHADKNAANKAQRSHYLLQPGWRADKAVQGLGRTHRTNQASAPVFHLLESPDIPGQKRFVSTIARRLGQLGALTRGQAQTGGGVELFSANDNLESREAEKGLESFLNTLKTGGTVNDMAYPEFMSKLGFKVDTDAGGGGGWRTRGQSEVPEMRQFLNRVLALKLADQQEVFRQLDDHIQSQIEQARAAGTLDNGVERYKADKIVRDGDDETVFRDPETGAEAKLVRTKVTRKADRRPWQANTQGKLPLKFVQNQRSGRVWAVYDAAPQTDTKSGTITPMFTLRGPGGQQHVPQINLERYDSGFKQLEHPDAKRLWDDEYNQLPESVESNEHFVTGDLLSVWDKLPGDRPKIFRVPLADGTSVVGRHIPTHKVEETLKRLGASSRGAADAEHTPEDVHARVLRQGATAVLANGWKVKRARVGNENRLELDGPIGMHRRSLQEDGVRVEKIASKDRYFIPTGPDGAEVLGRVIRGRNAPVTEVRAAGG